MSHLETWIGLALMVVVALFATANVALRHFSRTHVADRLEALGRAAWLQRLVDNRNDLIFCTSVIRVSAMLALVLLITHLLGAAPTADPVRRYAVIFVIAMTVLLVVGVAIPNAWARYAGDSFLIAALPVLIVLRYALWPLLAVEHLSDALVRRLAGVTRTEEAGAEAEQIEQEILSAVSEGEAAGTVHEADADMIASVIEFRDKDVAAIMTPRTGIVALPTTATLIEAKETIVREGHSRIPIYGENIDDIQGVLYAKDLLSYNEREEPFDPTVIMRKVPFVPETKRIPDLLAEMREKKVHLAIVVDEYGGVAGLVTMGDLLEGLFGEVPDRDGSEAVQVKEAEGNALIVPARMPLDEFNRRLEADLPEDVHDTLGGFVFDLFGRLPAVASRISHRQYTFTIEKMERTRILEIRVRKDAVAEREPPGASDAPPAGESPEG